MDEKHDEEWPNPRDFPHYKNLPETPPPLPNTYTIYGLEFQKTKTHVKLSETYEDLDLNEIKEAVKKSYDLFKAILKAPENRDLLAELRDLHLSMNTKINKAKRWELENSLNTGSSGL